MRHRNRSSAADDRQAGPARPRPLTAVQESLFFAVLFAVGLSLQLAAVLLQVM